MPDGSEQPPRAIRSPEDARAEFAAYRAEILGRSDHQHKLLALNFTALTAVAGLVLGTFARPSILLLLPIVSSSIGLLWYDHARNIDSLGDYIRNELPAFRGYEDRIARLERDEFRRVPMTIALVVLFIVTPLAALIIPFRQLHGALWGLWAAGVLLSAACLYSFGRWIAEGFGG